MIGATLLLVAGLFPSFQPEPAFNPQPLLWEVPVSYMAPDRPRPGLIFSKNEAKIVTEAREIDRKLGPGAAADSLAGEKAFEVVLVKAHFKEKDGDLSGALAAYESIVKSTNFTEPRALALSGYKRILRQLISRGHKDMYGPLIQILKDEWLNEEALDLLPQILADPALPQDVRAFVNKQEPIMAMRLGRYDRAVELWSGSDSRYAVQWLSHVENRRGNFTGAAELREKLALQTAAGRRRTKELNTAFTFLVKGGLYLQAAEFAAKYPILKNGLNYHWSLGLAALAAGEAQAQTHFQAVLDTKGAKDLHQGAQYFLARSLEVAGKHLEARTAYEKAASGPFGYYRILAQGRLAPEGPANLSSRLVKLMDPGPQGQDSHSLGYQLWITEKGIGSNELAEIATSWGGSGPELLAGKPTKSKEEWVLLLAERNWEALARQIAEVKQPPNFANPEINKLWPSMAASIAAAAGNYRLTIRLLSRIPADRTSELKGWSHPLIYTQEVRRAYGDYGLPPTLLLALIRTESAFQANIMSASNARGLMQILPATAAKIATTLGEQNPGPLDLFDPSLNIRYGSWYLKALIDGFGCEILALTGYNGGPYNIKSLILAKKNMPLDVFVESLPFQETIKYVKRITESRFIYESVYLGQAIRPNLTLPVSPPNHLLPSF